MQALPQTIHLEMDEQKRKQLKAMLGICQGLGAETRYHPEHRYFTAMVWTGWDTPCGMGEALAVQQEIQRNGCSVSDCCVLLLRPIQHTGLHGLSQVCKNGRLVPLAQERPFQNFYFRRNCTNGRFFKYGL